MRNSLDSSLSIETECEETLNIWKSYKSLCDKYHHLLDTLKTAKECDNGAASLTILKDDFSSIKSQLSMLSEQKNELETLNGLSSNLEKVADTNHKKSILEERMSINKNVNENLERLDEDKRRLEMIIQLWEEYEIKSHLYYSSFKTLEDKLDFLRKEEGLSTDQMVDLKSKLQVYLL